MEKVDCLAIAAHRDDLDITSGGLIAKLTDRGYKVAMLEMTAGEMGSLGDADLRAREAKAAAKVLGVEIRDNLNLPDAYLEVSLEIRNKLAQKIRDYKPELVILPIETQRHPDHRVCSRVGYDACFYAGLKKAQLGGEPHRPRKIIYGIYYPRVEPNFAVDITEQFERKLEAIRCYKSQINVASGDAKILVPGVDILDYIRIRDRELGQQIRVTYAEGYIHKEVMAIDDPLQLGGMSV